MKPLSPDQSRDALAGIRVLDFTSMIAGPYAARLLADVGAEVIKIEAPEGDDMRQRAPLRQGHGSYFGQLNAGKKSVTLDLKQPEAIALVKRMVEKADVVVENFRPGVMQRLGLDYATLSAINPRLVYCAISGYGQEGPNADRPAYAPIVHAASGFDRTLMRYAGAEQPMNGAVFIADVLGGIYAFAGIQTALLQRANTGQGQQVDVALMDCMLNMLVYELQAAQFPVNGRRPTYGPIAASDGQLLSAPINTRNFLAACEAIGRPDLKTDERFASVPARNRNWHDFIDCMADWSRERTVAECIAALDAAGVPCSVYRDPGDALTDPHLLARGVFAQVSDGAGTFTGVNPPYRLSGGAAELRSPVPDKGEHTRAVLADLLGVPDAALDELAAHGLFGAVH
jgi:crotonobetainyl-CoA:carnitine CoA-transferase CaiB-like acyl-CoA transferase